MQHWLKVQWNISLWSALIIFKRGLEIIKDKSISLSLGDCSGGNAPIPRKRFINFIHSKKLQLFTNNVVVRTIAHYVYPGSVW